MVRLTHKKLKIGWYSGRDELAKDINLDWFDYIKIGHYDEELGGLNKKTTNQRLYKLKHKIFESEGVEQIDFEDITSKFWK
jgi:anaerobic ribonucleoside-triphosphate reductase activating protein